MDLITLITDSIPYLSEFDYDHYPDNFDTFKNELSKIEFTGEDDLLDKLEKRRDGLSLWKKKSAFEEHKKVLALFLCPALKKIDREDLAMSINNEWNERYPKNIFRPGDFETLLKGFDSNLLGLPLRKSKKR